MFLPFGLVTMFAPSSMLNTVVTGIGLPALICYLYASFPFIHSILRTLFCLILFRRKSIPPVDKASQSITIASTVLFACNSLIPWFELLVIFSMLAFPLTAMVCKNSVSLICIVIFEFFIMLILHNALPMALHMTHSMDVYDWLRKIIPFPFKWFIPSSNKETKITPSTTSALKPVPSSQKNSTLSNTTLPLTPKRSWGTYNPLSFLTYSKSNASLASNNLTETNVPANLSSKATPLIKQINNTSTLDENMLPPSPTHPTLGLKQQSKK